MEKIYTETAKILKALSDPKRLRIVDMLSCGGTVCLSDSGSIPCNTAYAVA